LSIRLIPVLAWHGETVFHLIKGLYVQQISYDAAPLSAVHGLRGICTSCTLTPRQIIAPCIIRISDIHVGRAEIFNSKALNPPRLWRLGVKNF
jgi:hypothetical protein